MQRSLLNDTFCIQMSNNWEPSPRHMVRLDVRSLLQDAAIEEVNFFSLKKKSENYTSLLLIKINQHVLVVFFLGWNGRFQPWWRAQGTQERRGRREWSGRTWKVSLHKCVVLRFISTIFFSHLAYPVIFTQVISVISPLLVSARWVLCLKWKAKHVKFMETVRFIQNN